MSGHKQLRFPEFSPPLVYQLFVLTLGAHRILFSLVRSGWGEKLVFGHCV